jgi:hypothetical protein
VIVVVPTGKLLPAGTPERVTRKPGQLSLAVAVPKVASPTKVPHEVAFGPVLSVRFAGASMVGTIFGSSNTVTV